MLFAKKNKWVFVLISVVVLFLLCYTFYYVNECIEGYAILEGATTAPKTATTTKPTTKPRPTCPKTATTNGVIVNAADRNAKGGLMIGIINKCGNTYTTTCEIMDCVIKTANASEDMLTELGNKSNTYKTRLRNNGESLKECNKPDQNNDNYKNCLASLVGVNKKNLLPNLQKLLY